MVSCLNKDVIFILLIFFFTFPVFLQEVIDSLARGYEEKLKCDYLILEINSSRYAYNIQLHEVNFFVIRALLSMPVLVDSKNILSTVKDILKFFHPVISNYIKSKSSIMDCLRAVEVSICHVISLCRINFLLLLGFVRGLASVNFGFSQIVCKLEMYPS